MSSNKVLLLLLLAFYVCSFNDAEYLNKTHVRKQLLEYLDLSESQESGRKSTPKVVPSIMKKLYRKMSKNQKAVVSNPAQDQQGMIRLFFAKGMCSN